MALLRPAELRRLRGARTAAVRATMMAGRRRERRGSGSGESESSAVKTSPVRLGHGVPNNEKQNRRHSMKSISCTRASNVDEVGISFTMEAAFSRCFARLNGRQLSGMRACIALGHKINNS